MTTLAGQLNRLLTSVFGLIFIPLQRLSPFWAMAVFSFVVGVAMLLIFGKVSNQEAIKRIRDVISGNLIGVRLFRHEIGVVLRLQGRLILDTLIYMRYSVVPMLVMLVPILLIMAQLNLRFAARPLAPGERVLVEARVRDTATLKKPITLEAPGSEVETSGVRIEDRGEISWRVRAGEAGLREMKIKAGEEIVTKDLAVDARWGAVSARRPGDGFFDAVLYPGEAPLSEASAFQSIEVRYPPLELTFFGYHINWIVAFFVLSTAFGFAFKGLFGVQI